MHRVKLMSLYIKPILIGYLHKAYSQKIEMPYMVELLYQGQQILMFEHEWESKMSAETCPLWCFQIPVYGKH